MTDRGPEQGIESWIGHDVVDDDDTKIGSIEEIYVDDSSGQPEWLAIKTGIFGNKLSFAPIRGATARGDDLRLPFSKSVVKDAPKVDPEGHLEPEEEDELYRHYGRERQDRHLGEDEHPDEGSGTDERDIADTGDAAAHPERTQPTDEGVRRGGPVRLRKHVVTEDATVTVPVEREVIEVEREPGTTFEEERPT